MIKWHAHVEHMAKHMNMVGGPGPGPFAAPKSGAGFSLQRRCKTFCFVCFYQPVLCRKCVFVLWASCLPAKHVHSFV